MLPDYKHYGITDYLLRTPWYKGGLQRKHIRMVMQLFDVDSVPRIKDDASAPQVFHHIGRQ